MKKAVTVRVDPDLLEAARACAALEHRTLTNFIEMSLRGRIGEQTSQGLIPSSQGAPAQERISRGQ
jgi:hypothetical protein